MGTDLAGGQQWSSESSPHNDIAALNLPGALAGEAMLRLQQIRDATSLKDLALHLAYGTGLVRGLELSGAIQPTQAHDLSALFDAAHHQRVVELSSNS